MQPHHEASKLLHPTEIHVPASLQPWGPDSSSPWKYHPRSLDRPRRDQPGHPRAEARCPGVAAAPRPGTASASVCSSHGRAARGLMPASLSHNQQIRRTADNPPIHGSTCFILSPAVFACKVLVHFILMEFQKGTKVDPALFYVIAARPRTMLRHALQDARFTVYFVYDFHAIRLLQI